MDANFRLMILLPAALTLGCTMAARPDPSSMTSSTQGSTLVRSAIITAVGSATIAADAPALAGAVIGGNAAVPGQRTRTVTELTLQFDDGASVRYRIEPGVVYQPGERVQLMTRGGNTSITR